MVRSILITLMLILVTSTDAISAGWEVWVTGKTSDGARNRVSFGQQADATDGYDARYEVPAMPSGPISLKFPHSDWEYLSDGFWRDIRANGLTKSWDLEVNSNRIGRDITLTWDASVVNDKYNLTLTDLSTGVEVNMASQGTYSYTNAGLRQFVITSEKLVSYLEAPTGLTGIGSAESVVLNWTDNTGDETGYVVERKSVVRNSSGWEIVGEVGSNESTYADNSVDFDNVHNYSYRVKAVNGAISSDYSRAVSVSKNSTGTRGSADTNRRNKIKKIR